MRGQHLSPLLNVGGLLVPVQCPPQCRGAAATERISISIARFKDRYVSGVYMYVHRARARVCASEARLCAWDRACFHDWIYIGPLLERWRDGARAATAPPVGESGGLRTCAFAAVKKLQNKCVGGRAPQPNCARNPQEYSKHLYNCFLPRARLLLVFRS